MSEYTPGPWSVDQYRNHYVVMTADHHLIATVRSPLEANARLIAAAPDLLAFCLRAQADLKQQGREWPDMDAAITKAEGRQP